MWFSWDEWVDAAKLSATGGRRLGRPPKAAAPSRNARPAPERRAARGAARGGADAEEVAALKEHVAELSAANASRARRPPPLLLRAPVSRRNFAAVEERLTTLELSGRKGGLNVPPSALVAALQMLGTAEAELGQDAEVQRVLAQQGISKTVKKKPGLSSSELLVEACLRFATCMQAQAVENSKAKVAMIDTQLQMAQEQKAVRTQLVQMQQMMLAGFNTATGLANASAVAGQQAAKEAAATASDGRRAGEEGSHDDAVKIQAAFRGHKERQVIDSTIEEGLQIVEGSALEIQRHWRGKQGRDEVGEAAEAEAAELQLELRQAQQETPAPARAEDPEPHDDEDSLLGLSETELQAKIDEAAATKMQSNWRGYSARAQWADQMVAAEQIQAVYRGHRVRQAIEEGDVDFLGLDMGDDDDFLDDHA